MPNWGNLGAMGRALRRYPQASREQREFLMRQMESMAGIGLRSQELELAQARAQRERQLFPAEQRYMEARTGLVETQAEAAGFELGAAKEAAAKQKAEYARIAELLGESPDVVERVAKGLGDQADIERIQAARRLGIPGLEAEAKAIGLGEEVTTGKIREALGVPALTVRADVAGKRQAIDEAELARAKTREEQRRQRLRETRGAVGREEGLAARRLEVEGAQLETDFSEATRAKARADALTAIEPIMVELERKIKDATYRKLITAAREAEDNFTATRAAAAAWKKEYGRDYYVDLIRLKMRKERAEAKGVPTAQQLYTNIRLADAALGRLIQRSPLSDAMTMYFMSQSGMDLSEFTKTPEGLEEAKKAIRAFKRVQQAELLEHYDIDYEKMGRGLLEVGAPRVGGLTGQEQRIDMEQPEPTAPGEYPDITDDILDELQRELGIE